MKILVTGNLGFIGSHLTDKLVENRHTVFGVDDLSGGFMNNINSKIIQYQMDCRHEELIDAIFKENKPEIVFHLAANAAELKSNFSPIDITSRNFDAFIKVLTPFIKYGGKRFVYTSSIAAYGALQTPFKETDRPEPDDLYGISKYSCEMSLKSMAGVHKFEYVITRPHNVYGPRQNMTDPYRNVVTIFMNALLQNKPYYIYGDGTMKRCFSYIDDVVESLYDCGFEKVSGKIFNIGSDKQYSIQELSDILQKVTGIHINPNYLPKRPNEVQEAISDHTLAKKFLHHKDKTSLEEGLKKTWEWAQSVGYQEPVFTDIEIDSPLLPKNWRNHA